jgi:hypothetical protein
MEGIRLAITPSQFDKALWLHNEFAQFVNLIDTSKLMDFPEHSRIPVASHRKAQVQAPTPARRGKTHGQTPLEI